MRRRTHHRVCGVRMEQAQWTSRKTLRSMGTTTEGLMRTAIEPTWTASKSYTGMHQAEPGQDAAWSTTPKWRCTTPGASSLSGVISYMLRDESYYAMEGDWDG
jgi:hypothetical protein